MALAPRVAGIVVDVHTSAAREAFQELIVIVRAEVALRLGEIRKTRGRGYGSFRVLRDFPSLCVGRPWGLEPIHQCSSVRSGPRKPDPMVPELTVPHLAEGHAHGDSRAVVTVSTSQLGQEVVSFSQIEQLVDAYLLIAVVGPPDHDK